MRPAGLLLAALLGLGCVSPPADSPFARGAWPLRTADRRPWAGTVEGRALGPLLHWESEISGENGEGERRLAVRPLYSLRRGEQWTRHDLLYPLAGWSLRPERDEAWLMWLARRRSDPEEAARETILGPAYTATSRDSSARAADFGLFPLFGRFSNRFGLDRLVLRLWPLYARAHKGAYTEHQVLWPFFAYGRGEGRYKLRLWPLYGVERSEGTSVRRFFLWPFVHRRVTHLDTPTPERGTYVLPLYGRRDHGALHMRFYLFPLLARQWDDRRPDVHRTELLWPLVTSERDAKGGKRIALRPLFERHRSPHGSGMSVGLGLIGRSLYRSDGVEGRSLRLLWVGRISSLRGEGLDVRRADLWPLLRRLDRRGADGSRSGFVRMPYLLPMRGVEPDGWDRLYNKLFELYGARWEGDERRSSLLFGLREARSSSDEHWVSWGGLLHIGPR